MHANRLNINIEMHHLRCYFLVKSGFPESSVGKESTCNAGTPGLILKPGRSPGEGTGYPLQCSWASLVAQLVKNPPATRETWTWSLGWEDPLEKGDLPLSPGKGYPLQYYGLENSVDCIVHGVSKSWTRLSDFHHSLSWRHVGFCPGVDFAVLGDLSVVVGWWACQLFPSLEASVGSFCQVENLDPPVKFSGPIFLAAAPGLGTCFPQPCGVLRKWGFLFTLSKSRASARVIS